MDVVSALQSMVTEEPLGMQMVHPIGTVSPLVGKMAVSNPQPGKVGCPSEKRKIDDAMKVNTFGCQCSRLL